MLCDEKPSFQSLERKREGRRKEKENIRQERERERERERRRKEIKRGEDKQETNYL